VGLVARIVGNNKFIIVFFGKLKKTPVILRVPGKVKLMTVL
jgi:hypothetical protein